MSELPCLALHQPYLAAIADGLKTVELRSWTTSYRGPLLLSCTSSPRCRWTGHAVILAELSDVVPFEIEHAVAAGYTPEEFGEYLEDIAVGDVPELWAWLLEDVRALVEPVPVRNRTQLFPVALPDTIEVRRPRDGAIFLQRLA